MKATDKRQALADATTMYREMVDAINNDRVCVALMCAGNEDGETFRRRVIQADNAEGIAKIGFLLLVKEALL